MINENIKRLRKAKGLSQEALALRLNVVRQTVSKWEKGQSVPDSEMLIKIADELETTVNTLLGETVSSEESVGDMKILSCKLESINEQYAKQAETKRKVWRTISIVLGIIVILLILKEICSILWFRQVMSPPGGSEGTYANQANKVTAWYIVASTLHPRKIIPTAIMAAVSVIGIVKTGKGR